MKPPLSYRLLYDLAVAYSPLSAADRSALTCEEDANLLDVRHICLST